MSDIKITKSKWFRISLATIILVGLIILVSKIYYFKSRAILNPIIPQISNTSTLPVKEIIAEALKFFPPLDDARQRVTKKPFGIKVSPNNSPVKPEKFSGYHTAVDFEIKSGEENKEVLVSAICSGPLILKRVATGYGGVAVLKCKIDKQTVTIIYGHLKLSSIKPAINKQVKAGETFAVLGQGYSAETAGERKHLHLGIHLGETINLRGYVSKITDLKSWLNVLDYLP